MNFTPIMQATITEIAEKHGLNLQFREAALKLEREPYMPLVIEKIGPHRLSVAHYYVENGDAIADPDMEFFTGDQQWLPYAITQVIGGYQNAVEFNGDCTQILRYAPRLMRSLAEFGEMWAGNIKTQGWLDAKVVYVKNLSEE